ncbi:MAG: hypothetical protein ACRDXE_09730, partial [Acidimicrobiales bacterium]
MGGVDHRTGFVPSGPRRDLHESLEGVAAAQDAGDHQGGVVAFVSDDRQDFVGRGEQGDGPGQSNAALMSARRDSLWGMLPKNAPVAGSICSASSP